MSNTRPTTPVPRTTEPQSTSGVGQRLRFGFITHLDHTAEVPRVFDENLALFRELEQLGYDSAWVATRHFRVGWAGLPSPFAFLGAAAGQTSTIGLGTAVLPIVADDPVRVAEEVAVLDHLSGGRLQLGIGKGVPSNSYSAFSRWGGDREADFDEKVDQLHWALDGGVVPGTQDAIWPRNDGLRGRIYHGTSTWETIRRAARLGDGFLLERFGVGEERDPVNRPAFLKRHSDSILEYRAEFERTWGSSRTPWVVLSRSAWPGRTTDEALAEASAATERWNEYVQSFSPAGTERRSAEDELLSDNVLWGGPEELAAKLIEDPSFSLSDELLLGIHPGSYTLEQAVEKARMLIEEVAPILQDHWQQTRGELAERVTTHLHNSAEVVR